MHPIDLGWHKTIMHAFFIVNKNGISNISFQKISEILKRKMERQSLTDFHKATGKIIHGSLSHTI